MLFDRYGVGGEIDYGKAVGDEDDGCVGIVRLDVLKYFALCLDVECRCGFVEQQYVARVYDGTCNGNALCLSFRQSASAFAAYGVESVGQVEHEVGKSYAECLVHVLGGGFRVAHAQVVAYGAGEERVALRHV